MYILLWSYYDKSAFGIVTISEDEESLKNLLKILNEHGDTGKSFTISKQVPMIFSFEQQYSSAE